MSERIKRALAETGLMEKEKVARLHKRKKFLNMVFPTVEDGEYLRVLQAKEDFTKVEFFNDVDDLNNYIDSNRYNINTYYSLATCNGKSGQDQDLINRNVLAFDFDKKDYDDLTFKDIMYKFKSIALWYHALVDSGYGYHAYICIEPTQNIQKVVEVTKAIATKLGADLNSCKSTQVFRVPYTFNIKHNQTKQVNIISQFDKDTIKRYDINKLYSRFCSNSNSNRAMTENKATTYTLSNNNIVPCIQDILQNGSKDGHKNLDLQKIVVTLRRLNKTLSEIQYICKEWNCKSENSFKDNELQYQVEHMYNNLEKCSYECKECKHQNECFSKVVSDFEYSEGEILITMSEIHMRYLKASNRKGTKIMKGAELLVYSILKNHSDGMTREEIIKDMTYKSKKKKVEKCAMSHPTLTKTLKSLEENSFITSKGKTKIYKLKEVRSKIQLTYTISMSAVYECVKDNISTEELRLYCYMRYIHNKEQRENLKTLKGNLFQCNQVDLAKDLGVTQGRISQMIDNLLEEKLLGIWYRQPSKNNGFDFNIYKLNY